MTPQDIPRRIPLASQCVEVLREGLERGRWSGFLPGERLLAAELGVGRGTLRLALAELEGQGWLEGGGRQRRCIRIVPEPVQKEEPVPVIGVLSPIPLAKQSSLLASMVDTLRERIGRTGGVLQFHCRARCFSERPDRALAELTVSHPATCWLVLGSREPMQRWFCERRIPCLVVGSGSPSIRVPSVDIDHRATCRHAVAMLRRKGHRHICVVLRDGGYGGDLESEAAAREVVAGDPAACVSVIRHDGTAGHLRTLLDATLSRQDRPTAYLVGGPGYVVMVLTHLMRRGLRIPEDAALVARDDAPFLELTSPQVARYTVEPGRLVRKVEAAIRRLMERGVPEPAAMRIIAEFVSGETVESF
ncbi:MAG TPA: substrate-binding domain-containing protein [Bacteroidia bacterium]|nr:substrate-binding domain-containing protein [Bacteroidia bacterium]